MYIIQYAKYTPSSRKVYLAMSEAIISRRGYTAEGKPELRTEVITGNTNWTVPNYKKGNISVCIFGGGAGNRGGSGWMNNVEFNNLTPGTNVRITVGIGGNWDNMVGGGGGYDGRDDGMYGAGGGYSGRGEDASNNHGGGGYFFNGGGGVV